MTVPGGWPRQNPVRRRKRQPSVARGSPVGFRVVKPLRDQGQFRMAVTARGFLRATAGSAGIPFFHPGIMRVDRSTKSDAQVVKRFAPTTVTTAPCLP